MNWTFRADRPIYIQLEEQIKLRIVSGMYAAGQQMPTVRELAEEAAVNPNTLQRALAELERQGLLYTQRTSGRFVTEDDSVIERAKNDLAREQVSGFLKNMFAIGYSRGDVIRLIEKETEEGTENDAS